MNGDEATVTRRSRAVDVRAEFDRGARRYDAMVAANPGYARHLRTAARELVEHLRDGAGCRLLDLACGSGLSTKAVLDEAPNVIEVLGVDSSNGMLEAAARKKWPSPVRFERAEVGALDVARFGREHWDGIFAAYLIRNIAPDRRDQALCEVFGLLRPGGWLVVEEYSVADSARARSIWNLVCWAIIIPLGVIVDRNPRLYRYLWRSVRAFDSRRRFLARLSAAGFRHAATRTVPGWQRQILHIFVAQKPEGADGPT